MAWPVAAAAAPLGSPWPRQCWRVPGYWTWRNDGEVWQGFPGIDGTSLIFPYISKYANVFPYVSISFHISLYLFPYLFIYSYIYFHIFSYILISISISFHIFPYLHPIFPDISRFPTVQRGLAISAWPAASGASPSQHWWCCSARFLQSSHGARARHVTFHDLPGTRSCMSQKY